MQALSKSRGTHHSVCNNSLINDVKLRVCENPWRPARFIATAVMTEDEKTTEEIYKKMRGVLNKLAPANFERLLDQVHSLNIDTTERLQGVIDLVFEKAVDEPNFSVVYALLCRELALMQVPATDSKRKEGQEFVNFRKLLVTRCQLEFEKNSIDETERNRRIKEIDDCTDPEKKKDMHLELEDYDRRLRMKSVGNIRFIGELFKQQMLTVNIMLRCLYNLLETKDEESLECLCTLLNTVGKELEAKKVNLSIIFDTIKDIADKKHGKISNTIRFMILDVIDLRASQWVSGRSNLSPKTMDYIQKEFRSELIDIRRKKWTTDKKYCRDTRKDDNWRSTAFSQNSSTFFTFQSNKFKSKAAMNAVLITPRREDRGGGGGGVNASADKKRSRNVSNDDGWSTAPSCSSRTPFTVQSDKLKNKAPMMDKPLGSIQMFGNWGRRFNIKTQPPLNTNTASLYTALGRIASETVYKPIQDFLKNPPLPDINDLKDDQLKSIMQNYCLNMCSIQDLDNYINISACPSQLPQLVSSGYSSVSKAIRLKMGFLFAHFIKRETLSLKDYCIGLENVLEDANKANNEAVWNDVAAFICPVVCEVSETPETFQNVFELLINKEYSPQLLFSLLKLIIEVKEVPGCEDYSVVMDSTASEGVSENSENQSKDILQEYLNGLCDLQKCEQYIKDSISPSAFPQLVSNGYLSALEKSKKERLQTGFFFAQFLKWECFSLESYCSGLSSVLEEANELIFDIPNIWDNVAELIFPVLCDSARTPVELHQLLDLLIKNHTIKLLSCLFRMFLQMENSTIEKI